MSMPNFFIIGAAKSGTTALYHFLKQHPQIFLSEVKEPNYFAFGDEKPCFRGPGEERWVKRFKFTNIEAYRALFESVSNEIAIGDASPSSLFVPRACERIRRCAPNAKLIAILRNPVERAYSNCMHLVRDGIETEKGFLRALDAEEKRARDNWSPYWRYKEIGFYYGQMSRYYDAFDRSQIKVYLYEDLKGDAENLFKDVFHFLGVDESFEPDTSVRYNASGIPKNGVPRLLRKLRPAWGAVKPYLPERMSQAITAYGLGLRNRNLYKPALPQEARSRLTAAYREDILKLQDLIGRDLSRWLG